MGGRQAGDANRLCPLQLPVARCSAPSCSALTHRCNVRACATAPILLSNTTDTLWQLRPIIQNDFWSGPEFIKVRDLHVGGHAFRVVPHPLGYLLRHDAATPVAAPSRCLRSGVQSTP